MSDLTPDQRRAVTTAGRDVLVTAGAGSGKTRTLVGRYLWLLEGGLSPRQIVAITFTEKAAREMRSRVRAAIANRMAQSNHPEARARWADLEAQMDAARIGTIHSLCAEILRTHPAEAQVDPLFEVVEEGTAAALQAQAVEEAMIWAIGDPRVAPIFSAFSTGAVSRLLTFLLQRRLDAAPLLDDAAAVERGKAALQCALQAYIRHPDVSAMIQDLQQMRTEGTLERDAGKKLAAQVRCLLSDWERLEACLEHDDPVEAAGLLFTLRRQHMGLQAGRRDSKAKVLLRRLRDLYDALVNPWLGGNSAQDASPDPAVEARFTENLPRLRALFHRATETYRKALDQRNALDFDDLEAGALALLKDPAIRQRWQALIAAVLVDEFQDTNERQRAIVEALCGARPGHLFVVGDARQSIYRFRGADVTVFRRMRQDVEARGGEIVELDITFRAHEGLVRVLDDLLATVMGTEEDPERPYVVPFTPLRAHHPAPLPPDAGGRGVRRPFVEFVLGLGETAETARPHAAQALVRRLVELREEGQIQSWDDVALLFRASTGFPAYEDALENLGVPFVTIAGRGFYERPEVRDVLNMLRALADPWDDAAFAGLLRSPAFGLTDVALYRLRWQGDDAQPLRTALQGDLSRLDAPDRERALRARAILEELEPLVDRLPVAELLKRLIDRTDYRAALAASHSRLWRNLDKLLADAYASGLIRVRAFLAYVRTLRDVGAREGEAPAEAEGAIRLMTIHKAKGLEFDFVVLADATRRPRGSERAYLLPETGLAVKPDRLDADPLILRLARFLNRQQTEAEEARLLYVAATRARQKLLVSGHVTQNRGRWRTSGWLQQLMEAAGIDVDAIVAEPGVWHTVNLAGGEPVGVWVAPESDPEQSAVEAEAHGEWPASDAVPLYRPLVRMPVEQTDLDEEEPIRDWRAIGAGAHAPAAVVGRMVHRAIQRWRFPGDAGLDTLLESMALDEGLVDPEQRARAIREATRLLQRLREDALWREIDGAAERYHEMPFTRRLPDGRVDSGAIDLLYRTDAGWHLVDFKTDELRDQAALEEALAKYRPQLTRYIRAMRELLGEDVQAWLCFLDYRGSLHRVRIEGEGI